MRSASSISSHSLLEEVLSLTVLLPNFQEVESMFRETLENLSRSRSAEKHDRIGLATEDREGANTQDKAERLIAETCHHLEDMIPLIM